LVLPRSPAAWGIETPDVAMQITNVVRGRLGEEGNQQPAAARSLPTALAARSVDVAHELQHRHCNSAKSQHRRC
jgi:hypothetical protein